MPDETFVFPEATLNLYEELGVYTIIAQEDNRWKDYDIASSFSADNISLVLLKDITDEITITITGLSNDATPVSITGTATFSANSKAGTVALVTVADDKKFTSITSVEHSGGTNEDIFAVYLRTALYELLYAENLTIRKNLGEVEIPQQGKAETESEIISKRYQIEIGALYLKKGVSINVGQDKDKKYLIELILDSDSTTQYEKFYGCNAIPSGWIISGRDPAVFGIQVGYKPELIVVI